MPPLTKRRNKNALGKKIPKKKIALRQKLNDLSHAEI